MPPSGYSTRNQRHIAASLPSQTGGARQSQTELMGAQLQYLVRHSSFYARKFRDFHQTQISGMDAVADLPMTTLSELRFSQAQSPPLGLHATAAMRDVRFIHASSGTAAPPHYVGITSRDWEDWARTAQECFAINGVKAGDVVIDALSFGMFTGGLPIAAALQRMGTTVVPAGPVDPQRLIRIATDAKVNFLLCTPSYMIHLMDHMTDGRLDIPTLRGVLLGAEPGGSIPELRRVIERFSGVTVLEALGNADLMPIYAAMCGQSEGNHFVAFDSLFLELIDPNTGKSLSWTDGVEGELVATHLSRECTPVVRLRTGDIVRAHVSPCPCGRASPRLTCLGRIDDAIVIDGHRILPSEVQAIVASFNPEMTLVFEIVHRQGDSALNLRVEYGIDARDLDDLEQRLISTIAAKLSVRSEIELLPPDTLPRYEMKSRRLWRV